MIVNLILESKNFESDKEFQKTIEKNPCDLCLLGKGLMCAGRKFCRWHSHKEIYIKKEVVENIDNNNNN